MLIEESEILLADLPVEAFKAHLRLGRGFSGDTVQDSVLESFLRAAIASVEGRCGKALMIRTFIWTLPFWQDDLRQVFPIGPVQEVLELALLDAAEQPTVVDPARFRLEKDMHFPALNGRSAGLPNPPADGSIRVRFTAGYGATWDEVPRAPAIASWCAARRSARPRAPWRGNASARARACSGSRPWRNATAKAAI